MWPCDHMPGKQRASIYYMGTSTLGWYLYFCYPVWSTRHIPVLLYQHTYNNLMLWYGVYDPVFSSLWAECCLFLNIQWFLGSWLFLRLLLGMFQLVFSSLWFSSFSPSVSSLLLWLVGLVFTFVFSLISAEVLLCSFLLVFLCTSYRVQCHSKCLPKLNPLSLSPMFGSYLCLLHSTSLTFM